MAKVQNLELTGEVTQELGNGMFRVLLDTSGTEILCTISGKIRKNIIRILVGDKVKVEVSPYDLTKGRIELRLLGDSNKNQENVKRSINKKQKL